MKSCTRWQRSGGSKIPAWWIHDKYASKLGIGKSISREINVEIDSIDDMKFHDYDRFISSGGGILLL